MPRHDPEYWRWCPFRSRAWKRWRTPKRSGKVERSNRPSRANWGLGQRYRSSEHRAKALPHWLQHYNTARRHSGIGNRPPISRVRNVPGQDI